MVQKNARPAIGTAKAAPLTQAGAAHRPLPLEAKIRLFAVVTALLVVSGLAASPLIAGAWTLAKDQGRLFTTLSYRDSGANTIEGRRMTDGGLRKFEAEAGLEHGLSNSFTVGAKASWQSLSSRGSPRLTNSGPSTLEVWGRQRLWEGATDVISAQGMVRAPLGYDSRKVPVLGDGQFDYELRALWGHNMTMFSKPAFTDVQLGYRMRAGWPSDEVRLDATIGVRVTPEWLILGQSFNTVSVGNGHTADQFRPGSGYEQYKLQLSAARSVTDNLAVTVGGFVELPARNSSSATGALVGLHWSY